MEKLKDNFAHLHVHSSMGSMKDSMARVDELFKKAATLGQRALGITDHGTMAAVFDARKASVKYGVKYIPGIEAYFVDDVADMKQKRRHIVLLAKNEIGYKNLLRLNWNGYLNLQHVPFIGKVFARIDWKMLEKYKEGIICLTACGSGILSKSIFNHNDDGEWNQKLCDKEVIKLASKLKSIFGEDLYLELQPHNLQVFQTNRKTGEHTLGKNGNKIIIIDQRYINKVLCSVSNKLGIKTVATADVHYLNKEDAEIHDMLMAINQKAPLSDKARHRYEVNEFYMKSKSDITEYFTEFKDKEFAEQLCNTTIDIAEKCSDSDYLDTYEPRFPQFDCKSEPDYDKFLEWNGRQKNKASTIDSAYMRYQCIISFKKKYGHLQGGERKKYIKRMMIEIEIFELRKFSSYMLITSDFIRAAKNKGIPVGDRGSVGGSLVANLLDIHSIDPIKYGLLFERFHNKEKKSFPDIDTDFSPDGRGWVEKYIVNKYGKEKVAHVSNLSRMTTKVSIKDIARSLELGGGKSEAFKIANQITDSIPNDCDTFEKALKKSEDFRKYCTQYPDLEKYGSKLSGLERAYATHAAGIVIGDIDLTTYVPLRIDKKGIVSVQYEKNRCEALGLIKMDLLGLEHLRIIENTIKNARSLGQNCLDVKNVPMDDKNVWKLFSNGETMCVFQMESTHMRALCKKIKPKNIEDLSLVNALGRPSAGKKDKNGGPAPRDIYISRRDGKTPVTFKYECLKNSTKETLGVVVYEEQLMNLAHDVAGWDKNKADSLRKLTKFKEKGAQLAVKLEKDFIKDAISYSNLKKEEALDIWENIIEPFSKYGFNKAHGIFYSINGYHSAYYKLYYKSSFMAAVLKSEVEKASSQNRESNIRIYKKEANKLGLSINAPDINFSGPSFTVLDNKTIVTGLAAIKGVGEKAVLNIIEERKTHRFKSFADFLLRTSSSLIRKNVIQPLAKAGCFDSLGVTRKNAHDNYSITRTKANKHFKKIVEDGKDSWDILNDFEPSSKFNHKDEWTKKEILRGEQETLGEYISGDANEAFDGFFTGRGVTPLSMIKSMSHGHNIRTESIIVDIKQRKTKNGKIYADCSIQDINGASSVLKIWPELWNKNKRNIIAGIPIRAICKINIWRETTSLILERIEGSIGA